MRVVRGGDAGAEPEDDERGDGGGDARAGVRVFGVAFCTRSWGWDAAGDVDGASRVVLRTAPNLLSDRSCCIYLFTVTGSDVGGAYTVQHSLYRSEAHPARVYGWSFFLAGYFVVRGLVRIG